jgi:CheY-like chemotaxis protein
MSKRILVVEDQPDSRQIIRDMLAGTDYEITEAENGEEALTAVAKQRPDLILMDIQLPIMDGYTGWRLEPEFAARASMLLPAYSLKCPQRLTHWPD